MNDVSSESIIVRWLEKRRQQAAVAAACLIAACTHPHEPQVPADVFSPDCLAWGNVQEVLADLGFHVLVIGGRLDPGALSFDPPVSMDPLPGAPELGLPVSCSSGPILTMPATPENAGEVPLGPRRVQLAPVPGISPEDQKKIDDAVERINRDPEAVAALAWHYTHASQICRSNGGCADTRYSFRYQKVDSLSPDDRVYQWFVDGKEYPSSLQWSVYATMYSGRPPLCPLLPSLSVRTRASGIVQIAGRASRSQGLMTHKLKNPCPCGLGTDYGRGTRPNCSDC